MCAVMCAVLHASKTNCKLCGDMHSLVLAVGWEQPHSACYISLVGCLGWHHAGLSERNAACLC